MKLQHKRKQWIECSALYHQLVENVSGAAIFVIREADCERTPGVYLSVHDQVSEQPTKRSAKRASQGVLGYMVKRLSAHGGCLGSKRR